MARDDDLDATASPFGEDWPEKAVDLVDLVVDTIRDRLVRPIILVGRTIVYGLLISAMVVVFAVVVAVAVLRLFDVYLFAGHVWASYTVLGIMFSAGGLYGWSKRNPPTATPPKP